MPVIGFSFSKMKADRVGPIAGQLQINNNVAITDVKEAKVDLAQKAPLAIAFDFSCDYGKEVGSVFSQRRITLRF